MDPELAMALRISAEENRAAAEAGDGAEGAAPEGASEAFPGAGAEGGFMDEEEAMMAQALAMSMQVSLCLRLGEYYSILLVVSCFLLSSELESSGLLISYHVISLA